MKKTIIYICTLLILLASALALDVTVDCPAPQVGVNEEFTCNLKMSEQAAVSSIVYTIQPGDFDVVLVDCPTDYTKTYNAEKLSVSCVTTGQQELSSLGMITLKGSELMATGVGESSVSITLSELLDAGFNPISATVVGSGMIKVGEGAPVTCTDSDTTTQNDKVGVVTPFLKDQSYINYGTQGSVTGGIHSVSGQVVSVSSATDSCSGSTLKEYYCDYKTGYLGWNNIDCEFGCSNGACLPPPACSQATPAGCMNAEDCVNTGIKWNSVTNTCVIDCPVGTVEIEGQLCQAGDGTGGSGAEGGGTGDTGALSLTADDASELLLFQKIKEALDKHENNSLQQITAVAGVFNCYFKQSCDLAVYVVN